MSRDGQFDAIAHECLDLNERIKARGTDTMKLLMRVLLLEIGQEIARQHEPSPEYHLDE